ncbi:hypothetical protein FH972_017742 [Carpinus fangiana]|nr:hypothetical protein FH972_017742 [Carpinus fangiana]
MTDTDIANKRKTLNRKLKEDVDVDVDGTRWPEWSSAADRRLLQSSPVTPNVVAAEDGSGDHKTVSAAVAAAPENSIIHYLSQKIYIHVKEYQGGGYGRYPEGRVLLLNPSAGGSGGSMPCNCCAHVFAGGVGCPKCC